MAADALALSITVVREINARPLTSLSAFWAGQVEI